MAKQGQTRDRKRIALREEEDQLAEIQRQLGDEQKKEGQLLGEEQAYHKNVAKRDTLVHDISRKYGLKGFDGSSLATDQWQDFRSRMDQLQQKARSAVDEIQVSKWVMPEASHLSPAPARGTLQTSRISSSNTKPEFIRCHSQG